MTEGSYGFNLYTSSPYVQPGGNLPNAGYLRVTMSSDSAKVEYVNTSTGNITYTYYIQPSVTVDPDYFITNLSMNQFSQPSL